MISLAACLSLAAQCATAENITPPRISAGNRTHQGTELTLVDNGRSMFYCFLEQRTAQRIGRIVRRPQSRHRQAKDAAYDAPQPVRSLATAGFLVRCSNKRISAGVIAVISRAWSEDARSSSSQRFFCIVAGAAPSSASFVR